METAFLENGQIAQIVKEIDGKFLVRPGFVYQDYETEDEYDEFSDNLKLVDKVYAKPPKEKLNEEISQLETILTEKRKEIQELAKTKQIIDSNIEMAKKAETKANKLIFNRSDLINAKSILLFRKSSIMPVVLDNKRDAKLSFQLKIIDGKIDVWDYQLYGDYWSSGEYFDEEYGLLVDFPENQVEELTIKRVASKPTGYFYDYQLKSVDDKYLTPKLKENKYNYINKEKADRLIKVKAEIDKLNTELAKLKENEQLPKLWC